MNLMLDKPKLSSLKNRKNGTEFQGPLEHYYKTYGWNPEREENETLEEDIFEDKLAKYFSHFMKNHIHQLKKLSKHLLG